MKRRTIILFILSMICCVVGITLNKPELVIIAAILFSRVIFS